MKLIASTKQPICIISCVFHRVMAIILFFCIALTASLSLVMCKHLLCDEVRRHRRPAIASCDWFSLKVRHDIWVIFSAGDIIFASTLYYNTCMRLHLEQMETCVWVSFVSQTFIMRKRVRKQFKSSNLLKYIHFIHTMKHNRELREMFRSTSVQYHFSSGLSHDAPLIVVTLNRCLRLYFIVHPVRSSNLWEKFCCEKHVNLFVYICAEK